MKRILQHSRRIRNIYLQLDEKKVPRAEHAMLETVLRLGFETR